MGVPQSPEAPSQTRSVGALAGHAHHHQYRGSKLVILMVGLPASGKSYISKKLCRYLQWLQYRARVFNVGNRRREAARESATRASVKSDADFFDPASSACVSLRDQLAINTLDELLAWLGSGGDIGILDATNSTTARRKLLTKHIRQQSSGDSVEILFLESICTDEALREANVKLKLFSPDYVGKDPEASLADFRNRFAHYERAYEPLGAIEEMEGLSFVQTINVGKKLSTHMIRGYVLSQIVEYLLNFNLAPRQIWLTRNGESVDDAEGRIGRHSTLSKRGLAYANAMAVFLEHQQYNWRTDPSEGDAPSRSPTFDVWTSTWPQTVQTGSALPTGIYPHTPTKMLDDLNAGYMAGLTFDEIARDHPDEYEARKRDKLYYRWPGLGGEGYVDLIVRLRPLIVELERSSDNLLLITHRAVVRVLMSYFLGLQRDDLADLDVPQHTLFCFDIQPYGISCKSFTYDFELETFQMNSDQARSEL
ncbi:6-phosphofructo-2-kinase-domain-containing protein [Xylariaceae sp. FL1019]|nr:6-phosphofructo-2-kinase-domain-containing protein [Xylariaceae sp. FL1019]